MDEKIAASSPLQFLRRPLFVAMASGWVALAGLQPAVASTSLTSQAVFNFNFTTEPVTQPPYFGVFLDADLGGSIGPLTITIYNGLDGSGGTAVTFTFPALAPFNWADLFSTNAAGTDDGVFSVGLQSGSLLLNSIHARGCINSNCTAETATIPGTLSTTGNVPEPATLALLGIAIAGFAATRRKPRS